MSEVHEELARRVYDWRARQYPSAYPAIAEILEYAVEDEQAGQPYPASGSLRYLRLAQLLALETYWYLRLVERTPRIEQLYASLFASPRAHREAYGLTSTVLRDLVEEQGLESVLRRVADDEAFAHAHRLDALRESLGLAYPSWILALAMGAGKTVLVGAIIATEFAMALEYPEPGGDGVQFIENALVFAPGKTIIESLRELARIPYERILPARFHQPFAAALKLTFTRDGEKDIPVIRGSSFNLIVTNTEKIRIQARGVRRYGIAAFQLAALEDQSREEANLRLRAIASLPHLAVFSDEAHHTYGHALGARLKRVRQTVDYLAANSPNLIAVVNTTGTPYFQRQPLKDVVVWYGLSQGIEDGILKEVRGGNIQSFPVEHDQAPDFVRHVVSDFFTEYRDVTLPDGAPAKLAIYFPQTDDLEEFRPVVELALADLGLPQTMVLAHTSRTGADSLAAFNRLNDPRSEHRVILLVNMGTEGWNCPSLFATALARRLTSSNNFVLQAASRCLRQVPGNDRPARIYLSADNRSTLDRQLQETYGERISDLDRTARTTRRDRIRLNPNKLDIPPIRLRRTRRILRRAGPEVAKLAFTVPAHEAQPEFVGAALDVGPHAATRRLLRAVGDAIVVERPVMSIDIYRAAVELGANAHRTPMLILRALRAAYPAGTAEIPVGHLRTLASQLEASLGGYVTAEVTEEVALRVVKPEGFDPEPQPDGSVALEADISYPEDRAGLVFGPSAIRENIGAYGFHYTPYNFDSRPEAAYFERVLEVLNMAGANQADVYYIGALTSPDKTELGFDYVRADGRSGRYTPDFLVRCDGDRWYLVEIKREAARGDPIEGDHGVKAQAVRSVVEGNRDRLDYSILFTPSDDVLASDVAAVRSFIHKCRSGGVQA
jgi:type III restriction enzyme